MSLKNKNLVRARGAYETIGISRSHFYVLEARYGFKRIKISPRVTLYDLDEILEILEKNMVEETK